MNQRSMRTLRLIAFFCLCYGLDLDPNQARAFALLGPYEQWMQSSNNFRVSINFFPVNFDNAPSVQTVGAATVFYDGMPGYIGGPMSISNEYRWNTPVVTYGFDPSFLNYFGTNGVAAVKNAIAVLNDLPEASSLIPTNYPLNSELVNLCAATQSLYDLKSVTLSLLLEQLGLASPARSTFVLKELSSLDLVMRNYDSTLAPSSSVNGVPYSYEIYTGILTNQVNYHVAAALLFQTDEASEQPFYPAVADNELDIGQFYTGLTEDDAAGLWYLYSSNNVNYESLLADVSGAGATTDSWVNGAWRPGIEKVTFVPQPTGTGSTPFLPMTNQYTDTFITNGEITHQQLQRVIRQPDFLFCAGDTSKDYPVILPYTRTGTSNWINNAVQTASCSTGGPGIIQPPVRITFATLGRTLFAYPSPFPVVDESFFWGTFDQTTNVAFNYSQPQASTNDLLFRLWLLPLGPLYAFPPAQKFEWSASGRQGTCFIFQTSTNLTDWTSIVTNGVNGTICTIFDRLLVSQRYYRIISK
jgi:hypothetical protein